MSSSEESYDESDIWLVKRDKSKNSNTAKFDVPMTETNKNAVSKTEFLKEQVVKEMDEETRQRNEARQAKLKIWKEKKAKRRQKRLESKAKKCESSSTASVSVEKKKWDEIKPFLTVNDHMQGPVEHGNCGPKTELELMIEKAIDEDDFAKAEQLSDHLADRKFAVKIATAFQAKRFLKHKAETEAAKKLKKRKKLYWGFGVKQKWQMKANM